MLPRFCAFGEVKMPEVLFRIQKQESRTLTCLDTYWHAQQWQAAPQIREGVVLDVLNP